MHLYIQPARHITTHPTVIQASTFTTVERQTHHIHQFPHSHIRHKSCHLHMANHDIRIDPPSSFFPSISTSQHLNISIPQQRMKHLNTSTSQRTIKHAHPHPPHPPAHPHIPHPRTHTHTRFEKPSAELISPLCSDPLILFGLIEAAMTSKLISFVLFGSWIGLFG
jgi:hypothetical protein